MGLLARSPAVSITLSSVDTCPGTQVRADVLSSARLDQVRSGVVEWGYVNFYKYRWAGSQDAANTHSVSMYGSSSQYGTDKKTEDWVSVQHSELPVTDGFFETGHGNFLVPSWAPGSSDVLARWECRVRFDRSGRDAEAVAEFVVRVPPPRSVQSITERVLGNTADLDIVLDDLSWRAGQPMRGAVSLATKTDLPAADIAVHLTRERVSHPLTKTPAAHAVQEFPRIKLGERVFPTGVTTVPFEIPTETDFAPTGDSVHTSLDWYVEVRVLYKGFRHGMDQARRRIAIFNY